MPVRAAHVPAAKPGRALRVLVMDDEPSLRLLLGQMLRKAGHAAVPAADGREAVELYVASLGGAQRILGSDGWGALQSKLFGFVQDYACKVVPARNGFQF